MADLYGDIPYREAYRIEDDITQPAIDPQSEVYPALIEMLLTANDLYRTATDSNGNYTYPLTVPGKDLLYGGDIAAWQKLTNSLCLRLCMRLSNRPEAGTAAVMQQIVGNPVKYPVFTSYTRMAQWVRIVGSDDVHGVVSGVVEPDGTGASVMNPAVLKQYTTPVWFMTSSELFFILSEAAHTGMIPGGEAAAEAYYEQAVTNSIRQWNPSISDANIDRFLHGTGSKAAYDGTLERIIQQKWVSVFMQGFEAWCDYRRTGYPQLPIGPDVQNEGVLPTRLGYGQMLISTNGDNYRKQVARMKAAYPVVGRGTAGGDNMLTPVWWSKRALELENGAMN